MDIDAKNTKYITIISKIYLTLHTSAIVNYDLPLRLSDGQVERQTIKMLKGRTMSTSTVTILKQMVAILLWNYNSKSCT